MTIIDNKMRSQSLVRNHNSSVAAAPPATPTGNAERRGAREKAETGDQWTQTTQGSEKSRWVKLLPCFEWILLCFDLDLWVFFENSFVFALHTLKFLLQFLFDPCCNWSAGPRSFDPAWISQKTVQTCVFSSKSYQISPQARDAHNHCPLPSSKYQCSSFPP